MSCDLLPPQLTLAHAAIGMQAMAAATEEGATVEELLARGFSGPAAELAALTRPERAKWLLQLDADLQAMRAGFVRASWAPFPAWSSEDVELPAGAAATSAVLLALGQPLTNHTAVPSKQLPRPERQQDSSQAQAVHLPATVHCPSCNEPAQHNGAMAKPLPGLAAGPRPHAACARPGLLPARCWPGQPHAAALGHSGRRGAQVDAGRGQLRGGC